MDVEVQVRQSDVVTTITSVTLISVTTVLMIFFKTRSYLPGNFAYILMLMAIVLLSISAFKSYIDISIASYGDVKEVLNIKLFAYFGGLIFVGIIIIYSLYV